ncbi:GFA family protein [Amphiplicatus metriothermophilus]|uniref:Uncharacterized conserved protein n=1 Tax=Amphiplicatus metriothermophilus TaxID=1519374 RepID=A0A239PIK9_9PROT|nr:GFA family protein [Amphiplicatus metriothermophilus]MBB5518025.1 hypothetical protein [Amphiplicatus metriothermophilus]SNT67641.1 Uncharacterized conserved protein [Amphiplicatus metriothermophilus]
MSDMKDVTGGCHCGAVRFEAKVDLSQTNVCNCSHCEKKGFVLSFTPRENFRLLQGEDQLTEYRFNKKKIAHVFCKTCGVQAFAWGEAPDGAQMAAVNARCIDGVDLKALTPVQIDGRSF